MIYKVKLHSVLGVMIYKVKLHSVLLHNTSNIGHPGINITKIKANITFDNFSSEINALDHNY